jgi:hypothetical protein
MCTLFCHAEKKNMEWTNSGAEKWQYSWKGFQIIRNIVASSSKKAPGLKCTALLCSLGFHPICHHLNLLPPPDNYKGTKKDTHVRKHVRPTEPTLIKYKLEK